MKKNVSFLIRAVLFVALLALILAPLQTLFARKSLTTPFDMTNKIGGFFNEAEHEFEVMFFGSSHAYAAVSPLAIWDETGVKSYVLATQQQPLWATCTYLEEALKSQSPALVVLEVNMATVDQESFDEGVTYSYMDELPLSWNKVRLAWRSAEDMEGRVELLFNFVKYHSRWDKLIMADITFDRDSLRDPYKGFVLLPDKEEERERPDLTHATGYAELLEKNEYWLRKIIQLCEEKGIELWLIKSPSNLLAEDKEQLNTVERLAEEYGLVFRDFNEDYEAIGLSGERFFDKNHLDGLGADRFSRYLAQWMVELRPELAADPDNEAWAEDYAAYAAALSGFETE